jgi:molybdenum cofactor cytidylyltransferase
MGVTQAPLRVAAVLLAAGRSERYGAPKLALPFGGETVGARALRGLLDPASGVNAGVWLVVSHLTREAFPDPLPAGVQEVLTPAHGGQGDSLARGIGALPRDVDVAVVALADQPLAAPEAVAAVVAALAADPSVEAVRASCGGVPMPPAAVRHSIFPLFQGLSGDEGGGLVLGALGRAARTVELGEGPWRLDVDTPVAYAALLRAAAADVHRPPPRA